MERLIAVPHEIQVGGRRFGIVHYEDPVRILWIKTSDHRPCAYSGASAN